MLNRVVYHPSCVSTDLVEVSLSEIRDGFVYLQIIGKLNVLGTLHHVNAPSKQQQTTVFTQHILFVFGKNKKITFENGEKNSNSKKVQSDPLDRLFLLKRVAFSPRLIQSEELH